MHSARRIQPMLGMLFLLGPMSFAQMSITYQGQLKENGATVTNPALPMSFQLYDAEAGGSEIGSPASRLINVQDGLFAAVLSFGDDPNLFNGQPLWLEITVDGVVHTPRQEISAAPYALFALGAGTVPDGSIGTEQIADGSITPEKLAAPCMCPPGWTLFGNGGTNPSIHFLGTTDSNPLVIKVNNIATMRYAHAANLFAHSMNVLGGTGINSIAPGMMGATIAGGGLDLISSPDYPNTVNGDFGSIGGGYGNLANFWSTVGGGTENAANGFNSTIAGGYVNIASGDYSFIGGGSYNSTTLAWTSVGGGAQNGAYNDFATVGGGNLCGAYGEYSFVGGGYINTAGNMYAAVGGGAMNTASSGYSFVGGGQSNHANSTHSTIGGGEGNFVGNTWGTIGGGYNNQSHGDRSTVGGGYINQATGDYSTVAGGRENRAHAADSTVTGGHNNSISNNLSTYATISGGDGNIIDELGAVIGGGLGNYVSGRVGVIGGGEQNQASGDMSVVPGGMFNVAAGIFSFAAGQQAQANHQGTFVWSDSSGAAFASTGTNQFLIRAAGGVGIGTAAPAHPLHMASGAHCTAGGVWTNASGHRLKENFADVDARDMLRRVGALPIRAWNYKNEGGEVRHMGPMAEDFHACFGLGGDPESIGTIDADGVALAAIQGLHQIVNEQDARIETLERQNAELTARLERLERLAESGT